MTPSTRESGSGVPDSRNVLAIQSFQRSLKSIALCSYLIQVKVMGFADRLVLVVKTLRFNDLWPLRFEFVHNGHSVSPEVESCAIPKAEGKVAVVIWVRFIIVVGETVLDHAKLCLLAGKTPPQSEKVVVAFLLRVAALLLDQTTPHVFRDGVFLLYPDEINLFQSPIQILVSRLESCEMVVEKSLFRCMPR